MTITLDTSLQDALKLVFRHPCRQLPVIDTEGRLLGIVSTRDLPYASPTPRRRLGIFELQYQLANLHVEDIMTTQVVTTSPDTIIEEATRLMVENRAECLVVVQDNRVVGLITRTEMHDADQLTFVTVPYSAPDSSRSKTFEDDCRCSDGT